MNFKLLLCVPLFATLSAHSQSKNNISVLYGFGSTSVDIHGAVGDFGYTSKTGVSYGAIYSRNSGKIFSLETGLVFYDDKTQINVIQPPHDHSANGDVKLITIPIMAKWTFWKSFFIETGLSVDKQINYSNNMVLTDQSGIGNQFGIGGIYTFRHISVFVNPYWRVFAMIPFSSYNETRNLIDYGIKFGAGYNF